MMHAHNKHAHNFIYRGQNLVIPVILEFRLQTAWKYLDIFYTSIFYTSSLYMVTPAAQPPTVQTFSFSGVANQKSLSLK